MFFQLPRAPAPRRPRARWGRAGTAWGPAGSHSKLATSAFPQQHELQGCSSGY